MYKVYIQPRTVCGYRALDAQRLRNYFLKNNQKVVYNPKDADYIILITCGVTNQIAESFINMIKKFQNYDAELIVAGCLPIVQPRLIAENFNGRTIVTSDLICDPDKIDQLFPGNKIKFRDIEDSSIIEFQDDEKNPFKRIKNKLGSEETKKTVAIIEIMISFIPLKIRQHVLNSLLGKNSAILHYHSSLTNISSYCIRISWGCTGNCTYCGARKAMYPHVSKPLELILTEFKDGLKQGYKNFYISAEDAGSYGVDIGSNLPELLEKMTEIEGDYEIFLGGVNPVWVVKYIDSLEKIFKKGKIKRMEFTIQSGSSRILKLMKRYSNIEKIKDAFNRLKKAYPDLEFYPHIMFGFPTETDEDFKATLSFIKEMDFKSGQIYRCSCIPGTEAAEIEPKVPEEVILERTKYLKKFLKKENYRMISDAYFYK